MLSNMKRQYCKAGGKQKSVKFTDGKSMLVCQKALSVFYATLRKNKWDDTKPRPKATSETVSWFLKVKGLKK